MRHKAKVDCLLKHHLKDLHGVSTTIQTQQSPVASRLADKVQRLGLSLPLDLERLAVMRGCDYYDRDLGPRIPPLGEVPLSNAELAIALIVSSFRSSAREIRLAAALLGAPATTRPSTFSTPLLTFLLTVLANVLGRSSEGNQDLIAILAVRRFIR